MCRLSLRATGTQRPKIREPFLGLRKSGLRTTTSSLRRLLDWNVEDFVLHLAGDGGVAFNHRPQSRLLNERERSGVQV
jgi:hypothetical protein